MPQGLWEYTTEPFREAASRVDTSYPFSAESTLTALLGAIAAASNPKGALAYSGKIGFGNALRNILKGMDPNRVGGGTSSAIIPTRKKTMPYGRSGYRRSYSRKPRYTSRKSYSGFRKRTYAPKRKTGVAKRVKANVLSSIHKALLQR